MVFLLKMNLRSVVMLKSPGMSQKDWIPIPTELVGKQ